MEAIQSIGSNQSSSDAMSNLTTAINEINEKIGSFNSDTPKKTLFEEMDCAKYGKRLRRTGEVGKKE